MSIGGIGVVSIGVVRSSPIPWARDSSISVAFGIPLSNILLSVSSFSYNVIIDYVDQEMIVNQVFGAFGVGSID